MNLYIIYRELSNGYRKPAGASLCKKDIKKILARYKATHKVIAIGKKSNGGVFHSIQYIIKDEKNC